MKIVIYQLSSVKEFVNSARKTLDYWSGSFLLSFLNLLSIVKFQEAFPETIVYPYIDKSNQAISDIKGFLKSVNTLNINIPNRFTAIVSAQEEQIEETLKNCKNAVNDFLKKLMDDAKTNIEESIELKDNQKKYWDEIWQRQSQDILPIYWSITEFDSQKSYKDNYTKAELTFAGIKRMRIFNNIEEPGFKCTVCGIRQQCIDKDERAKYSDYNSFWIDLKENFKGHFKNNERLCSVCITRRLFPKMMDLKISFPSTCTISTLPFIYYLREKEECFKKEIETIEEIIFKHSEQIDKNNIFGRENRLYNLDGDFFILSNYENERFIKDTYQDYYQEQRKKLKIAKENLLKIINSAKEDKYNPYKYYGIIKFDFDNIGEKIEKSERKEDHIELSKTLNAFFSNTLPKIIDQIKYAKTIYAGGDEGIIFIHLDYLFDFLTLFRKSFKGDFRFENTDLEKIIMGNNKIFKEKEITVSTGVVICHHQESLKDVLNQLESTLNHAKSYYNKNAISFTIMKRSGEIIKNISFSWLKKDDEIVTKFLKELSIMFNQKEISRKVINDLKTTFFKYDLIKEKTIGLPIFEKELIKYYVKRHCKEPAFNNLEEIIEIFPRRDFIDLLILASYVSDGGGN